MPVPFSRTIRSLALDSPRRSAVAIIIAVGLLAAWCAWFFLAQLTLREVSDQARLEVDRSIYPIESPVGGRVVEVAAALDRRVDSGEVLFRIDDQIERQGLGEERARLEGFGRQLDALRREIGAQQNALAALGRTHGSALEEARARSREAESAARFADEQHRRLAKLHESGSISEVEYLRAQSDAQQKGSAAEALRLELERLQRQQQSDLRGKDVEIEKLGRDAAEIESDAATSRQRVEALQQEIERRTIRAHTSGRIGELATVRIGQVIGAGERLGAIVPSGVIRVVAEFTPSAALGRIHAGQSARVSMSGFPWTEYGSLPATVVTVAREVRDGHVRVELAPHPAGGSPIPLQHGLPGIVEVAVDHASPATLLLRTVGRALTRIDEREQTGAEAAQ